MPLLIGIHASGSIGSIDCDELTDSMKHLELISREWISGKQEYRRQTRHSEILDLLSFVKSYGARS